MSRIHRPHSSACCVSSAAIVSSTLLLANIQDQYERTSAMVVVRAVACGAAAGGATRVCVRWLPKRQAGVHPQSCNFVDASACFRRTTVSRACRTTCSKRRACAHNRCVILHTCSAERMAKCLPCRRCSLLSCLTVIVLQCGAAAVAMRAKPTHKSACVCKHFFTFDWRCRYRTKATRRRRTHKRADDDRAPCAELQ